MLNSDSIPKEFHGHRDNPGDRYHRFAAGLQVKLTESHGSNGKSAGHRLVQAAWHLRYAGVGVGIHQCAQQISGQLNEDAQFVYLSGFQLAVTSAVAAIDLAGASLVYLAGHEQREPDLRDIAAHDRRGRKFREGMSAAHVRWVTDTHENRNIDELADLRNALVHRHVPLNVTIRPGTLVISPDGRQSESPAGKPTYSIRVDEIRDLVDVDPTTALEVAVDRFVALGLLLYDEIANADGVGRPTTTT